jgi:WD40 repeat protein
VKANGFLLISIAACLMSPMRALNAQPLKLILPIGHTHVVTSVNFSPNGKKIVTTSRDHTVKLWDAQTGALMADIRGYTSNVVSACFSPDGNTILTTGDSIAKIWNSANGILLNELKGHKTWVKSAYFSPDGEKIITASSDSTVRIWKTSSGKLFLELKGHTDAVIDASFSPDGKKIVTASDDNTVKIWEAETGKMLVTLPKKIYGVRTAHFSPDSRKILTISPSPELWDADNGSFLVSLKGNFGVVKTGCFSPDGTKIATTGDMNPQIWNAKNGKLLFSLKGHTSPASTASFSPDSKEIVSASTDGSAKIWSVASGALLVNLSGHRFGVIDACFSKDGRKVATASLDHSAKIWDTESGKLLADLNGHNNEVSAYFSLNDKRIVTAAWDSTNTSIWNEMDGSLLAVLKGHPDWVRNTCFSSDGRRIVTAANDHTARVWDVRSGTDLFELTGHTNLVYNACYSADDKLIVTASADSTAIVSDATNGSFILQLKARYPINGACFSPDAQTVLTFGGSAATMWSLQMGTILFALEEHTSGVNSACFSFDGKKVVTASRDSTANIWDATNGKLLGRLKGHTNVVNSACFSPDGEKIVTGSWDATARIWDARNKNVLLTIKGDLSPVDYACFSTDGQKVITACRDNTVKIWDARQGSLISTFFAVDSKDYFINLPSGFYSCSPQAATLLHYVTEDLKVITFDQLDIKYNRPDKILEATGYLDTAVVNSYRNAYFKRIEKLNIDTTSFVEDYSIPMADFSNREQITYEQADSALSLNIHGADSNLHLERFNVWINGTPIYGLKGINLRHKMSNDFDTTISVKLSSGSNKIVTSVTNVNGTESYHMPLFVNHTSSKSKKEKVCFIGIGIDHFQNKNHDLQWSVKDIRDLATDFKRKFKDDIEIDTLFNEDATRGKILALKQRLLNLQVDDKVIIAYSGHGVVSKKYDYYLSTFDIDFALPEHNGLLYDEIENLFDSVPPRKKLLLIDACHSGEIDKEEMVKSTEIIAMDGIAELLSRAKKISDAQQKGAGLGLQNSFELMKRLFNDVAISTGTVVISAARGNQLANEGKEWGNGAFTYALKTALGNNESDLDHNGQVTISELERYVATKVDDLTKGKQVPTTRKGLLDFDWSLW